MNEDGPELRLDWSRAARTGVPEAIWCPNKTEDQIRTCLDEAAERETSLLLTRLDPAIAARVDRPGFDYDARSRTAILDLGLPAPRDRGAAIVAAGTSDLPAAAEAQRTLQFAGIAAHMRVDVGVAGLWRTMEAAEALQDARIVIACAGFEAALFSVIAGLIAAPVIAVPTSVGSGVAEGGRAALTSALASCAPGVVTVNIDNGFGAACAAIKILRMMDRDALSSAHTKGETP